MTKEQYLAYQNQVQEIKQKQKRQEELTQQEEKIIKTEKLYKISATIGLAGSLFFAVGVAGFLGGLYHGVFTVARLKEENKEALNAFQTEQVQKLNEEYANGNGFSVAEYSERLKAVQKNTFSDFMANAASEEVKMDYQTQQSIDNKIYISSGVIAPLGCAVALGGLGFALKYNLKKDDLANENADERTK